MLAKRRLQLPQISAGSATPPYRGRERDGSRHPCVSRWIRDIRRRSMLTISQVSKAFAGRTLFEDASLQVNRGDRVGLVGPNGAGKSTLFSLILGEASPDEGRVSLEKSATIGL